jgi:hypothetical protein
MKNPHMALAFFILLFTASCTEDYVIDVKEGNVMIGVEAYFSDEPKRHEAILSYTTDFYSHDEIRMVSGATVYVTNDIDTIVYHEDADNKGHYLTDIVAGERNTLYRLCIDINKPDSEPIHLFSESMLADNIDSIDSLVIKPYNGIDDTVPTVFLDDTIEWVFPYFQSLPDPDITYMPLIYKNDTLLTDSLMQQMLIPVGGYAGYYINGPEMQAQNKEIPIYYFKKSDLKNGDRIRAGLQSIPADYLYFFYTIAMSQGSNPMLGAPANVTTNIQPAGQAVGWFMTAYVTSAETIFMDN